MSGTRSIVDLEQLNSLVSTVRQDIVDTLLVRDEMSVRELARHLGTRPSSLYYHLAELERVGLVVRHDRVRRDGRPEARYAVEDDRLEIAYRPADPANVALVTRVVRSILRLAERDFMRGFEHEDVSVGGPTRNLWGARGKARLGPRDLERVNALLGELSDVFSRAGGGDEGTLCAISWVLAPVADRSGAGAG